MGTAAIDHMHGFKCAVACGIGDAQHGGVCVLLKRSDAVFPAKVNGAVAGSLKLFGEKALHAKLLDADKKRVQAGNVRVLLSQIKGIKLVMPGKGAVNGPQHTFGGDTLIDD